MLEGGTGLLNKGGGSNTLPGLVTKQQAVGFPQVLVSTIQITLANYAIFFPYLTPGKNFNNVK